MSDAPEMRPRKVERWPLVVLAVLIGGAAVAFVLWDRSGVPPREQQVQTAPGRRPIIEPVRPLPSPGAAVTAGTADSPGAARAGITDANADSAATIQSVGGFVTGGATDSAGRVYFAAEASGLWRFDPAAPADRQWTNLKPAAALPDDGVSAVAVDRLGRVWAGHFHHGVSVVAGDQWKTYDTTDGPLGCRVFTISVCPTDGDVWIATEAGLARYSEKKDTWSYYTRAEGLPSDQVNSIAFDEEGNVYLGTQCEGIAIAYASDDYSVWRVVAGPDRLSTVPSGDGLPTGMINQVLVTRDNTIWAATTAGLARSTDRGQTWRFYRGAEWEQKVRQLTAGPPADWVPANGPTVAEDYVTALAEEEGGFLWVGYRKRGYQCLDPHTDDLQPIALGPGARTMLNEFVTSILPVKNGPPIICTYGEGLKLSVATAAALKAAAGAAGAPAATSAALPAIAKAPTPAAFDAMLLKLSNANQSPLKAAFLGEDWATQGDWVGRYGLQARHSTSGTHLSPGYVASTSAGPHGTDPRAVYSYYATINDRERRSLYEPMAGTRRQGEWNDGSFQTDKYPPTFEGPDLWIKLTIPGTSIHRVSLYFLNNDGHSGDPRYRDYLVELKAYEADMAVADAAPALARTRVCNFYSGVYKQFVVPGGSYWIKIGRQYSAVAKTFGVFVDRLPLAMDEPRPAIPPYVGSNLYRMPTVPVDIATANATVGAVTAAAKLWQALDAAADRQDAVALQYADRVLAYRLAAASGAADALLANWRWRLPMWTDADHNEFDRGMADAWEAFCEMNPQMAQTAWRKSMQAAWTKASREQARGGITPLAIPDEAPTRPDLIKDLLSDYLVRKVGRPISARGLASTMMDPEWYLADYRSVTDEKAQYEMVGQFLLWGEALLERKGEAAKRRGLAGDISAERAAVEVLKDDWLADRIVDAVLIPNANLADGSNGSPITRVSLAKMLMSQKRAPAARAILMQIPEAQRGGEVAELLKKLDADLTAK